MPLESATYIHDLVATDPAHTDGLNNADAHLRLLKTVLQNTLPNATAPITATPAAINNAGSAFANAGTLEVQPDSTVAGAILQLDPVPGSGAVLIENTGTSGGPGGFSLVINDATNANPLTPLTVTRAGALATTTSLNAPSIQKSGNELLPAGVICMWSGSAASIPAGWVLCNGTNGTPNLEDRFLVGAGNSYGPGATGGSIGGSFTSSSAGTHQHTGSTGSSTPALPTATTDIQGWHSHGGTTGGVALTLDQIPYHDHGLNPGNANPPLVTGSNSLANVGLAGGSGWGSPTAAVGQGGSNSHSHSIANDGGHSHNVAVSGDLTHAHSISSDGAHTHTVTVATLPPYYALCFIMKL